MQKTTLKDLYFQTERCLYSRSVFYSLQAHHWISYELPHSLELCSPLSVTQLPKVLGTKLSPGECRRRAGYKGLSRCAGPGNAAWHGLPQHGMAQHSMAWHSTAWHNIEWHSMTWQCVAHTAQWSRTPAQRSHSNRKLQQKEFSSEQSRKQHWQSEGEPEGKGTILEVVVKVERGGSWTETVIIRRRKEHGEAMQAHERKWAEKQ